MGWAIFMNPFGMLGGLCLRVADPSGIARPRAQQGRPFPSAVEIGARFACLALLRPRTGALRWH